MTFFQRLRSALLRLLSLLTPSVLLLVTLLMFSIVLTINMLIIGSSSRFIYDDQLKVPKKQAALILGAQILGKNAVSAVLADRLETGIALYRGGKVKKILVSGDHGQPNYDEVNVMRRYLLAAGIPPQDIFMDHAGFDTYDSMYRARDVFHAESVIIVTQRFHLYRAVFIARALGLDAVALDATRRQYAERTTLHNDLREILARVKAFADVLFHSQPTYLGTSIPLSGDGRMTSDESSKF